MEPLLSPVYKTVDDCIMHADIYLPPPSRPLPDPRVTQSQTDFPSKRPVVIAVHAGAWIMGSTRIINWDQIGDCLARGWIVVVPEFRLCPQVDILSGPVADVRDCLEWVRSSNSDNDRGLNAVLGAAGCRHIAADADRVVAYGMSSGGALALALGFGVARPVRAVLCLYGALHYTHPLWKRPFGSVVRPSGVSLQYINQVYVEQPVPVEGAASMGGKWRPSEVTGLPRLEPRPAFAFTHMAQGTLLQVCCPSGDFAQIDPMLNVNDKRFPPTCLVHGTADELIPVDVARQFFQKLRQAGVRSQLIEIPGANHTFAMSMVKGDPTWAMQRRGFDFLEGVLSELDCRPRCLRL